MQNGSDFWLIDMARASESALSECVPKEKLKQAPLPFMIEDGLRLLWTAHKDRRYINRSFKSYR